jgi:hypothetical protein
MIHARNDRGLEEIRAQIRAAISPGEDFGAAADGFTQLLLDYF